MTWSIDPSAEALWACLTAPSHLSLWLGELVAGSVSAGQSFTIDHGEGYRCTSRVIAFEPTRLLKYSWSFPDEPVSEVSWSLSPEEDSTRLLLTHTGLENLVTSYLSGWMTHLTFLEAATLGSPLPISLFWRIHGTITHLNRSN